METKPLWFISTLLNSQGSHGYWQWTWHCDSWRQSLLLCHFIDLGTRSFNQQMFSLCTQNRRKKSNKQSLHSFLPDTVCGLPICPLQLLSQIHWWYLLWPENSSVLLTLTVSYIPLYLIMIMIFIFLLSEFISLHFLLLIK